MCPAGGAINYGVLLLLVKHGWWYIYANTGARQRALDLARTFGVLTVSAPVAPMKSARPDHSSADAGLGPWLATGIVLLAGLAVASATIFDQALYFALGVGSLMFLVAAFQKPYLGLQVWMFAFPVLDEYLTPFLLFVAFKNLVASGADARKALLALALSCLYLAPHGAYQFITHSDPPFWIGPPDTVHSLVEEQGRARGPFTASVSYGALGNMVFLSALATDYETVYIRIALYNAALTMAVQQPLIVYGRHATELFQRGRPKYVSDFMVRSHNSRHGLWHHRDACSMASETTRSRPCPRCSCRCVTLCSALLSR